MNIKARLRLLLYSVYVIFDWFNKVERLKFDERYFSKNYISNNPK